MNELSDRELQEFNDYLKRRQHKALTKNVLGVGFDTLRLGLTEGFEMLFTEMAKAFEENPIVEETLRRTEEKQQEEDRKRTERLLSFQDRTRAFEALLAQVKLR